ncbi:fimbria/pilus outer membrane usher protein [Providencia alcalifaciens]|uniref:fimbria/pilus outer membrane usher protein n=2 Tax=Enterobacterales TaxID=91347 RepID=UPI0032DA23EE
MERNKYFTINNISYALILSLSSVPAFSVEFNADVLDALDRENIDISRFSQAGYIMPGEYQMEVIVNGQGISPSAFLIPFLERPAQETLEDKRLPQACLTSEMIGRMGLTEEAQEKIVYWNNEQCADLSLLPSVEVRSNTAQGILYINIPQAWLEYSDASWSPPSQWDDGIPGVLFDYNISGTINKPYKAEQSQSLSYYGTAGINLGSWRLRGDYQGNLNHNTDSIVATDSQFSWNRFYMYRAIRSWRASLTLGENYLNSEIFSSWRYTGASLESDDRMLPPKLRDYAPQITGVADTNARIVISQQGRTLYDTTVPAGAFSIQDLDSSVRGRLNVEVIEQDGRKKEFQIDTAYVPYLTRPGQMRYKVVMGRSRNYEHTLEGPFFISGEVSRGISNKWSLYGGGIFSEDYNALAAGLGRDLNEFGAVSADVTQSVSRLREKTRLGKLWRLSYSKHFDYVNTDITFTGHWFSERNYMTMEQYLDARYRNDFTGREKESYTVAFNKNFVDTNMSINLQYSRQMYWEQQMSDYYMVSAYRYFDTVGLKNISLGVSASRSKYYNYDNDSVFLRLSVPWGGGTVSYSGSVSNGHYTNIVGYSGILDGGLSNYTLNAGMNNGKSLSSQAQVSGFLSHSSSLANVSANFAAVQNGYTSFGVGASGGATITTQGAALHAGGMNGGTRLLVDTDGVGGVPIDGGRVSTNNWGIGVVTNVNSYYRNTTSVDLTRLPADMEARRSVVESVLTEGAIGHRKFEVLKGNRLFAVLGMADNSYPPFGASVTNAKGRELGMVADSGLVWLSGVTPGERLNVSWDGKIQCVVNIMDDIHQDKQLLLSCIKS